MRDILKLRQSAVKLVERGSIINHPISASVKATQFTNGVLFDDDLSHAAQFFLAANYLRETLLKNNKNLSSAYWHIKGIAIEALLKMMLFQKDKNIYNYNYLKNKRHDINCLLCLVLKEYRQIKASENEKMAILTLNKYYTGKRLTLHYPTQFRLILQQIPSPEIDPDIDNLVEKLFTQILKIKQQARIKLDT